MVTTHYSATDPMGSTMSARITVGEVVVKQAHRIYLSNSVERPKKLVT